MTTTDLDRIEHQVLIDAPVQRVWDLVSEPGWYINDKTLTEHRIETRDGITTVVDPVQGSFSMRIVELDEPRYAAFRWLIDADDPSSTFTLVEFWLTPTDSGVEVKVAESGFASLDESDVNRRSRLEDHTEGWRFELELARAALTEEHSRA
ncbi:MULTISPECIES: SRPBCC domain-containing protein [unclassified Gordonia (in: high G+C Gram-positive bacteria)]|uniref:SRPBCC domain-containing protein n=1 Tax=unclassified Gordonia (in: high G+C Gram-positive bacteria) TaxID=2657482 RepID=UPI0009AE8AF0|nr:MULTISPECIES: SRPBCC domain-containing protein [unclassified Gordonia (in: high G+C Gram-positive bacteria)]MDF3285434.1 SRPBCC domain-containing protein [Gordonia sp. N1V]OPX11750.1 ATPase [Gordonia sp. i37]